MGNKEETGAFLVRLINLGINNLMHNPKRALVVLFASFAGVLIVGEIVTKVRDIDPAKPTPKPPIVYQNSSEYFTLNEIKDDKIVPVATQTVIVRSNIPLTAVPTKTPLPTSTPVYTPTPSCTTEIKKNGVQPGINVEIAYLQGYETEMPVRYKYNDSKAIVGTVKSGERVYVIEGHVCFANVRWWKVNSAKHRIVGWLPETVNRLPFLEQIKIKPY